MGFGVWGLEFEVWSLEFGVWGLRCGMWWLEVRGWGLLAFGGMSLGAGCWVQKAESLGLGFGVRGLGFKSGRPDIARTAHLSFAALGYLLLMLGV